MNKKGAEMTIGTIVIIVLALIVLVVVALGFTTGWRNLWDKVNVFAGGKTLATVGQACSIACEAGDVNGWCFVKRDYTSEVVGADGKKTKTPKSMTCAELAASTDATNKIAGCTNDQVKCT